MKRFQGYISEILRVLSASESALGRIFFQLPWDNQNFKPGNMFSQYLGSKVDMLFETATTVKIVIILGRKTVILS